MREIKFEKVQEYKDHEFPLPSRKTEHSAGYDFTIPEDIIIPSHYKQLIKLLSKKVISTEFLEGLADTSLIKLLEEIGETQPLMTTKTQMELVLKLKDALPELGKFISDFLVMDFEDVKSLVKETNTRVTLVPTGVKVKLKKNQKLELLVRSSTPLNSYIMMANSVGLIDADYYNNEGNEGHIYFQLINLSPFDIVLKKGDVIGQGIISEYEITTNDDATKERIGGLGSTSVE